MSDDSDYDVVVCPTRTENGALARVIRFSDGFGRIETWDGEAWRAGRTSLREIHLGRQVSPEELSGLPE